jgi:hypothetical protein
MSQTTWQVLTTAPNTPAAQALADSLLAHGVASRVVTESSLMGEALPCRIMVEATLLRRAQWLMTQGHFTDEELTFLATGAVSCSDSKE